MPRRLTTVAACRVAGYDRDRLNEYIANGLYDCAPSEMRGRTRVFDEDDTIALYFFAYCIQKFRHPREAAQEACLIRNGLRAYPESKNLHVVEAHIGSPEIHKDGFDAALNPAGYMLSGRSIKTVRTYNIDHARKLIAHGFDIEFDVAGEDD